MTTPVRLQLSRRKGFDLQALSLDTNGLPAVNVARPSVLGNPFVVGKKGTRAECVSLFIAALDGLVCLTLGDGVYEASKAYPFVVKAEANRLRNRNLACWCSLPKTGQPDLCHAAVLIAWIRSDTVEAKRDALRPILDAVMPRRVPVCEEA